MTWLIYAFLSAIFAALVTIFAKKGLENVDSILMTTIRSIIMAVFLTITALSLKKFQEFSFALFNFKEWMLIISTGIFGALSWLFYFLALKNGQASKVAAIDKLSLVFIIILSVLFLGEEFNFKSILGACLMILGAFLIVSKINFI